MNQEVDTQTKMSTPSREGIQSGLADRAESLKGLAQIKENLGQVAAGHEVHADASNVILTRREAIEHAQRGSHDEVRI